MSRSRFITCEGGNRPRAVALVMVLAVTALMSGCATVSHQEYHAGERVALGVGYEVTIPAGWLGVDETAGGSMPRESGRALTLYGPQGERVDLWCSSRADAEDHLNTLRQFIAQGSLDGEVAAASLWGARADILLGVMDEATGERMMVAYLWGTGQPLGIQAFGFSVIKASAPLGSAPNALESILDDIGLVMN